METFDFKEALSWMQCGQPVVGPGGRVYNIEDGKLVCYPLPVDRPKHRRVEIRLHTEAILYKNWTLYETSSK